MVLRGTVMRFERTVAQITENVMPPGSANRELIVTLQDFDRLEIWRGKRLSGHMLDDPAQTLGQLRHLFRFQATIGHLPGEQERIDMARDGFHIAF